MNRNSAIFATVTAVALITVAAPANARGALIDPNGRSDATTQVGGFIDPNGRCVQQGTTSVGGFIDPNGRCVGPRTTHRDEGAGFDPFGRAAMAWLMRLFGWA